MQPTSSILIIDDDVIARAALEALLSDEAYQLHFAANGIEGLALATAIAPDVILLDVMMPGMDGYEVCRRLRANSELADVPILMLTALDNRPARLAGLQAGADDFITKPFDYAELKTRVRTITRLNRYRRLLGERARLAQLIELSPNGIAVVDAAGLVRLANQFLVRLLQAESAAALEGQPLEGWLPDREVVAWQKVLTPGVPSLRLETELVRADGQRLPVELIVGGIPWEGQAAAQMIIRDITAEKYRRTQEAAIAEERRRIAGEIHDGLAQNLAALKVRAGLWHDLVDQNPAQMHAELDQLQILLRENIQDVRRSIFALRPIALDEHGFFPTLRQFLNDFGEQNQLLIHWAVRGAEGDLPVSLELPLFRIIQEALNNVAKHAQAQTLWLDVDVQTQAQARLILRDDGRGFDLATLEPAARRGHLGLKQMRERVEQGGGRLEVQSAVGHGTTLDVTLQAPGLEGGGAG
jgi:PAS domain S-box-containing protein